MDGTMPQRPPSETHDSRLTTHALNIGVLGRKGGSAKSTTAFNLAGALAARGRRCLLVDLDSQASLTRALSDDPVPPECGIGARLAEPKRGLRDTIRPVYDLIDLAPGDRSIEVTAAALAQNPAGPLRLRLLLDEVTGDYDAIIIDTAPLLGFTQTSALLGGDLAIVPTRTGAQQDIDALVDIFAMRDELERYRFATARVAAILPSNYHADEAPQRDGLAALHAGYDGLVADPIPHSPLIERAINARVPVVLNSPKSPVAAAFRRLAERLLDESGSRAVGQSGSGNGDRVRQR
ncbi:MAG TPA: ParA family protein [Thermomicrobiales bacterium]|nr:ParA family protein [Thermomicrobiales bacterium]